MKQDPWDIAIDWNLPHKNDPDGCLPFAQELFARLQANETPCRVIAYHWVGNQTGGKVTDITGIANDHAIIAYRTDDKRVYVMDACSRRVAWIPTESAASDAGTAAFFAGISQNVSNVRVLSTFNW